MGFFEDAWAWFWAPATNGALDATQMLILAAVYLFVGLFVAIIGLLFIAGKLPAPFGRWGGFVIGGIVVVLGVLVALGVF